jgi:acyl-CoA synthetase (AMP-forming)/AMP-acid ligase II
MVWGAFATTSSAYPGHDFLHVPAAAGEPRPTTFTYQQARLRVDQLVTGLRQAGFQHGHRVALALDNRAEFFLYFLALNRIGCSIVPVNAGMSRAELTFVLAHADLAAVIALPQHTKHIAAAAPSHVPLICYEGEGTSHTKPTNGPTAAPGEVAMLYTSGTTGTPKGCILTARYFEQAGAHYVSLGGYCTLRPGQDRLITPLPVSHMNALAVSFMAMLLTGGCLIQLDRFHPAKWWQSVRESRASCFHYLGVMPAMLLSAPAVPEDDMSGMLRFGFGAGVDPRHHAAFERRFGVPLIEAWAMTETGGGAWITANDEPRHVGQRCFGRAPKELEWRIVTDSGLDAGCNETGELWVRRRGADPRDGFFAGYYKDEAATQVAWADGWFHTGDLVRVDEAGSFYFVDRLKNIIRRSGENIAAIEVEGALLPQPHVRACAVTAVPDEMRGEEVFAFVVLAEGAEPDVTRAEALSRACAQALSYFKAPGYVRFLSSLPQTASQKLARGELKRMAAQSIADGTAFDVRAAKRRRA